MNRSTGVRTQDSSFTAGGVCGVGATNAQCSSQFAPCSIHVRKRSISSAESGGAWCGIRNSGSSDSRRAMSSEAPGLPGTMARRPDAPSAIASSRKTNEIPPCLRTPPWHAAQLLVRIGRMSRLKSTVGGAGDFEQPTSAVTRHATAARAMPRTRAIGCSPTAFRCDGRFIRHTSIRGLMSRVWNRIPIDANGSDI